jgi:prepilin signal peptidase PulO-like enzyme (type II secretory pathway)
MSVTTPDASAESTPPGTTTLRSGSLGTADIAFFVVSAAAPLTVMAGVAPLAILLGGIGAVVALAMGKGRKAAVPFGPFLAAGAALALFWGPTLADAYVRSVT